MTARLLSRRSSFIFCGIIRDLFSTASSVRDRFSFSNVFRINFSDWIRRRRLENDCWNVQFISTATFLHHDIRHRLLNSRLQVFAVVYRNAGSVFAAPVVCKHKSLIENVCFMFSDDGECLVAVKHVHDRESVVWEENYFVSNPERWDLFFLEDLHAHPMS